MKDTTDALTFVLDHLVTYLESDRIFARRIDTAVTKVTTNEVSSLLWPVERGCSSPLEQIQTRGRLVR